MRDILKTWTHSHLRTSKLMPRKQHPLFSVSESKVGKSYARQAKIDRKAIANLYRFYRNDPEHGPVAARRGHRYGICTTGQDARYRLKQLSPSTNPGPAWNHA